MHRRKYFHRNEPTLEQQLHALPKAIAYIDERARRKLPTPIADVSVPFETAAALLSDWSQLQKRTNTFLTVASACASGNGHSPLLEKAGIDLNTLDQQATQFNQNAALLARNGVSFLAEHTARLGERIGGVERKGLSFQEIKQAARQSSQLLLAVQIPEGDLEPKVVRQILSSTNDAMNPLKRSTMHLTTSASGRGHTPKRQRTA